MPNNSRRQNSRRQNNSESRRARSPQGQQPQLAYNFGKARGKKQKTYQALQTLATAPESVIQLVDKLYKAYTATVATIKTVKPREQQETAPVREYLQAGLENNLDAMLQVTIITTKAKEAAMVKRALRYVPHKFVDEDLLRDALNAGECKTHRRLARIGDLVQNLLLSELIYEGTDLSSGFAERQLKQVIGRNDYQAKQMLKNNLWGCVFQRQANTRKADEEMKLPADILEAVLGAVYLDTRTRGPHWRIECLKVMAEFKLDTAAAVHAWRELQDARLLRHPSLAQAKGKEEWLWGYRAMNDQLEDAQEHLQRMGLVI